MPFGEFWILLLCVSFHAFLGLISLRFASHCQKGWKGRSYDSTFVRIIENLEFLWLAVMCLPIDFILSMGMPVWAFVVVCVS